MGQILLCIVLKIALKKEKPPAWVAVVLKRKTARLGGCGSNTGYISSFERLWISDRPAEAVSSLVSQLDFWQFWIFGNLEGTHTLLPALAAA
jgi:hypothetical protein